MICPLPQPNPPPPYCCPLPRKFPHPPLAKGRVVAADTDSVDIVVEDIMVIEIVLVDIEQDDSKVALVELACAHHSSSSRYPSFSLATAKIIYNISNRLLHIYKIYNAHFLVYLQSSANTHILLIDGL